MYHDQGYQAIYNQILPARKWVKSQAIDDQGTDGMQSVNCANVPPPYSAVYCCTIIEPRTMSPSQNGQRHTPENGKTLCEGYERDGTIMNFEITFLSCIRYTSS